MEQKLESRYLIREQIGQGAFGVIYHALDEKNHREIAIKVWKAGSETEIFSHDNSPFLREERISGVVKIYDYFEKAGMNFLVMEYLPGGTLKQKLDKVLKGSFWSCFAPCWKVWLFCTAKVWFTVI